MNTNICIIHIYWGPLPKWFPYFLHTCQQNDDIDFLILGDTFKEAQDEGNILFIPLNMNEFNILASMKLNLSVELENPYKVCDFKPAFGKIFEDYLKDYRFWGYCDNDLLLGKISRFLVPNTLDSYDIISTYNGFLSGPFALFRNRSDIVNLFSFNDSYKNVFTQISNCIGYDENIPNKNNEGFTIPKILAFFKYLAKSRAANLWFKSPKEFRYQFQWFYKRNQLRNHKPRDMSEIIWFATENKNIRTYFEELLLSDKYYQRIGQKNWQIRWSNGSLRDVFAGNEIFGFHFKELKSNPYFIVKEKQGINGDILLDSLCIRNL